MRGTWQTTGGGGESGSVIALIAFIVLAIAGGVGHKALTGALHTVATAFEVIVWTVAGVVILAAAAGVAYVVLRIRTDRPAIDAPHSARSWPLPGWWAEIRPRIGGDDDEHRR
jgi:hypothetical protein